MFLVGRGGRGVNGGVRKLVWRWPKKRKALEEWLQRRDLRNHMACTAEHME